MNYASIIFWLLCALPFIGVVFYLVNKDKTKSRITAGNIVLAICLIFALYVIIYVTKDFAIK